ncbi:MAG: patatin-like phospholipase family protein [Thermoproteota archaeon]|nr:patatin-like phospholipase family protein [Thermoproteota archaeon]
MAFSSIFGMKKRTGIPEKERALVLQGGGSLGAYGAGVYSALYESLSKMDIEEGNKGRPIFDIIAGTSIGAINAAVLVSYVVENQTYEGSAERLADFWQYLSKKSTVEANPFFKPWWDHFHTINKDVASGEAARRYYSAKEFAIYGVPTVFYPHLPTHDTKFFDLDNIWYRYSNEPLKRSLERFAKFPIATTYEDDQPRLILVAVDIADGIPVTFDSYPKEDGTRKTEYGRFLSHNDKEIGFEHVVHYDKGITSDHVIASGSFPVNFDFAKIEVESQRSSLSNNRSINLESTANKTDNSYNYIKEIRYFWDGGLMANTPLMQLVLLHRKYWYRIRGLKDVVPRLGICVINLHPKKQIEIPMDRDSVINRNNDITFSDRIQHEEAMLLLASDYIDLVRALMKVAEEHGVKEDIINNLLNQKTRFHGEFLKARRFLDIVEGRFQIDEIIEVTRRNDEHTISSKIYDFSEGTIKMLFEQGYNDGLGGFNEYLEAKKKQPTRLQA